MWTSRELLQWPFLLVIVEAGKGEGATGIASCVRSTGLHRPMFVMETMKS